jgi:hypothetical protein
VGGAQPPDPLPPPRGLLSSVALCSRALRRGAAPGTSVSPLPGHSRGREPPHPRPLLSSHLLSTPRVSPATSSRVARPPSRLCCVLRHSTPPASFAPLIQYGGARLQKKVFLKETVKLFHICAFCFPAINGKLTGLTEEVRVSILCFMRFDGEKRISPKTKAVHWTLDRHIRPRQIAALGFF